MSSPKKAGQTKSSAAEQLPKAVPPPDNPLLRYEAGEGPRLEGPETDVREQARLRARAFEQLSRKNPDPDVNPDPPTPPD